MSLFSSIQLASNAIRAQQIGMQVVGQNIANANTEGYIREEVVFNPAPTQRIGNLLQGSGVEVTAIVQKVDKFLEERLRQAISDLKGAESQENIWRQLEGIVGELGDTDLSSSMNNFFASINEVLNQPESAAVRNLAVLAGQSLAQDINRLATRAGDMRADVNKQISASVLDINRLITEVRDLNIKIVETEGGRTSKSDAVGLRDQRSLALQKLSELVSIDVHEQTDGSVTVYSNGDFLVFQGIHREVKVELEPERGLNLAQLRIADTDTPLDTSGGRIGGLITARDDVLGKFQGDLDDFTATLIYEFNRIYSSGQGLTGFTDLTSEFRVNDATQPLDAAGLAFTPENGSFEVIVRNTRTGATESHRIHVELTGLDNDTTLSEIAAQIDAIEGVGASVTAQGRLRITADSVDHDFAFNDDTSGFLAAMGLNTFFSGTAALDVGVNQQLATDPSKFAASRDGIGSDTTNALELAAFINRPLTSKGGMSLDLLYKRLSGEVTQNASVARAATEGARVFHETLRGDHLAITGVSIDEEVVRLMAYQHAFQASARYISMLSEMMQLLVNL